MFYHVFHFLRLLEGKKGLFQSINRSLCEYKLPMVPASLPKKNLQQGSGPRTAGERHKPPALVSLQEEEIDACWYDPKGESSL